MRLSSMWGMWAKGRSRVRVGRIIHGRFGAGINGIFAEFLGFRGCGCLGVLLCEPRITLMAQIGCDAHRPFVRDSGFVLRPREIGEWVVWRCRRWSLRGFN